MYLSPLLTQRPWKVSRVFARLSEAQQTLAAALDGSGNEAVNAAHASLSHADQQLEECFGATLLAVEQAQAYTAAL